MQKRNWYKINAENKTLGRLATKAAVILMGKDKVDFRRDVDSGDFLIITNADKVNLTGNKSTQKQYFRASSYPGNSKLVDIKHVREKTPKFVVYHAVKGMLPKNKIANRMITRLKIYIGEEHPHVAQNPVDLENNSDKNE